MKALFDSFNTKHFKKAYPLIADIVEEPH